MSGTSDAIRDREEAKRPAYVDVTAVAVQKKVTIEAKYAKKADPEEVEDAGDPEGQ